MYVYIYIYIYIYIYVYSPSAPPDCRRQRCRQRRGRHGQRPAPHQRRRAEAPRTGRHRRAQRGAVPGLDPHPHLDVDPDVSAAGTRSPGSLRGNVREARVEPTYCQIPDWRTGRTFARAWRASAGVVGPHPGGPLVTIMTIFIVIII